MWSGFTDNRDRIPEGIRLLQMMDDLYLFGNSVYAENVYKRLNGWNVDIQGVIVSNKYYREGISFHGLEVLAFGELKEQKINLIAGYNIMKHEELNDILLTSENVNEIYYLDGMEAFMDGMRLRKNIILIDDYYKILLARELDYSYFQEHYNEFVRTYDWLADEKSRKTMECYLSGHIEVKGWPMLPVWKENDVEKQYFPDDIVRLTQHEVFVDCGAFTGDTLEIFCRRVDTFRKYYALEPDSMRFEELKSTIQRNCDKGDIVHLPIGVSDKKGRVDFSRSSAGCGQIRYDNAAVDDYESIELNKLDNLIDKDEKVTFIKMDIEGEELSALRGAENIIRRDKPCLAICVYHKREDLITIPQYIKGLVPEYQIFLRAHWPSATEVVLYCIC